jgi:hypothetical protein
LGQLVFELDFELGSVKAALDVGLGDVELTTLFLGGVRYLVGHERWGGEYELKGIDRLQLALQCLEGVDGETRCGYFEPRAWLD